MLMADCGLRTADLTAGGWRLAAGGWRLPISRLTIYDDDRLHESLIELFSKPSRTAWRTSARLRQGSGEARLSGGRRERAQRSEPRERSAPTKRRARERVREAEGRKP